MIFVAAIFYYFRFEMFAEKENCNFEATPRCFFGEISSRLRHNHAFNHTDRQPCSLFEEKIASIYGTLRYYCTFGIYAPLGVCYALFSFLSLPIPKRKNGEEFLIAFFCVSNFKFLIASKFLLCQVCTGRNRN